MSREESGGERPLSLGEANPRRTIVGRSFRRVDASSKVTGALCFADDLSFPRMAHMKLVRSRVPHARILRIVVEAARRLPGVLAVLTGQDLPEPFGILPVSQDEHALCLDRVRFVGDPVAAICAVSEEIAAAAADQVVIEHEPLETMATVEEALRAEAPCLHEDCGHGRVDKGNIHKRVALEFGGVDDALREADEVVEDFFYYEGNTHLALEQHACVAVPEGNGRITVHSSTQTPHYVHRAVAKVLGLPASRVRVVAPPNGGGFGGKTDPFNHEICAAKMALLLGRPVKVCLSREEVFYAHRGRHPVWMRLRTGIMRDGTITGQHLQTVLDGGAYGSYGVATTYYTGALQTVTYRIPKYRFEGARIFTNKPPCGPKRGHGTPQPRFGLEVQIDKIAHRLGFDPAAYRMRLLQPPDSVTANYLKVGRIALGRCIEAVVEGSGWYARHGRMPQGHGLGLACGAYLCGAGLPIYWNHMPHSGVQLQLDRSGLVTVFCGQTEVGQGSDSVLAALVAEVLGIELDDVRLCVADTDLTPVDLGSYSSRVTMMMGHAAIRAAERARDLIVRAAARRLEIPERRVALADGRVFDVEEPGRGMTFAAAAILAEEMFGTLGTTGSYTPPRAPGRYRGAGVGPSPSYSYSACVVEVKTDPSTGCTDVLKVWLAHDIGRAINPALVEGQIEGGVYMGLGEALMEEQSFRRLPRKLSDALVHTGPSMLDYKSLTALDMPDVVSYLIEEPDPAGPMGAKEVGQGPLLPVVPAVANAIYDAVGVRIDQVPITPHLILKALDLAERGREPRLGPRAIPRVDYGPALIVPTPQEGGDGRAINAEEIVGGSKRETMPAGPTAARVARKRNGGS